MKEQRAGHVSLSIGLAVLTDSTWEQLDGSERNLVRTLYHWRLYWSRTSNFPTVDSAYMGGRKNLWRESTIALEPHNEVGLQNSGKTQNSGIVMLCVV
jgi:hypothetical protein